jgi:hypothetical protein
MDAVGMVIEGAGVATAVLHTGSALYNAWNEAGAPSEAGSSGSTTQSVQHRSLEQDVQLSNYQGPDMDYFSGVKTSVGVPNKLADIFAKEYLAFYSLHDLSDNRFQGWTGLGVYHNNNGATVKRLQFPLDSINGDQNNIPQGDFSQGDYAGIITGHYIMSPWAAYKSNFAESRSKVRLRLKFNKTKHHQFTVRIVFSPTGTMAETHLDPSAPLDASRVVVKEFTLGDSNEITFDQPEAFSHNGWDHKFEIAVSIFNASVNMNVNPQICMQGYLSYHDCDVSTFHGLNLIPYFASNDYEVVPGRHISDAVLVTPRGRVHALCSNLWLQKIERWVTVSKSELYSAIADYEAFDGEKFKNLRAAYEVAPNLYDLVTTIISACVSRDAPSIGELLIKWTTLVNMLKTTNKRKADALIRHFKPNLINVLARAECTEPQLIEYTRRLIPVKRVKFHIAETVEQQCSVLCRHAITNRSYQDETKAESLTPARLNSTWHAIEGSPNLSFSWVDWFTPMFYANTGSWHMRYAPTPSVAAQELSSSVQIIGNVSRTAMSDITHRSDVDNNRHVTVGDSLIVRGTPLYMHIPAHQARPTVHQLRHKHFHEDWLVSKYKDRGQPNSPLPEALFAIVDSQVDAEGEIYLKPGKDFAFNHYLGFCDWIINSRLKALLDIIGPTGSLPFPNHKADQFVGLYNFVP